MSNFAGACIEENKSNVGESDFAGVCIEENIR
jgi:hypothetical protein